MQEIARTAIEQYTSDRPARLRGIVERISERGRRAARPPRAVTDAVSAVDYLSLDDLLEIARAS